MFREISSIALMVALLLGVSACASAPEDRGSPIAEPVVSKQEARAQTTVIGGFLGAFASDAIGEYADEKKRSKEETSKKYRHKQSGGILMKIENASVFPQKVNAGEQVDLKMTYAILGAAARKDFTVVETREIRYKGELFGKFKAYITRGDGTYASSIPLTLPAGAQKGRYRVILTVHTHKASASRETFFYVN
jgi:hypothetical protein